MWAHKAHLHQAINNDSSFHAILAFPPSVYVSFATNTYSSTLFLFLFSSENIFRLILSHSFPLTLENLFLHPSDLHGWVSTNRLILFPASLITDQTNSGRSINILLRYRRGDFQAL
nr:hypothetical protein CFP56_40966 [Quercus suber]